MAWSPPRGQGGFLEDVDNTTLQQTTGRFNVRGVLRFDGNKAKTIMCRVEKTRWDASPSEEALQQMLGLSTVTGNMALPAPAQAVADDAAHGMVLKVTEDQTIPVHRVFLLVAGTTESELKPVGDKCDDIQKQSFSVQSDNVSCLLSDEAFSLDLRGYCSYKGMLQFRLDRDVAFVSVSAWDCTDTGNPKATIDYMTKVSVGSDTQHSLLAEWRALKNSICTAQSHMYIDPATQDYWTRDAKRLKRMESEPTPSQPTSQSPGTLAYLDQLLSQSIPEPRPRLYDTFTGHAYE